MPDPAVLWRPAPDARATTRMGAYLEWLAERGVSLPDYDAAWAWSVRAPDAFWRSIRDFFAAFPATDGAALADAGMPGARWFPDARLNYAEHLLVRGLAARRQDDVVLIGRSQTRDRSTLTAVQLRDAVGRVQAGLRRLGVGPGDRVAAYLPNIPEAVIALLATAGLGAIWTSRWTAIGTGRTRSTAARSWPPSAAPSPACRRPSSFPMSTLTRPSAADWPGTR
jgi:acetoacetyl-CoA synthetase